MLFTHNFSSVSKNNLKGVHYELVIVTTTALLISSQDFRVTEGLRSAEKQLEYYNKGASNLKSGSRHQTGHAVDVAAIKDGRVDFTFDLYYTIADAFREASKLHGIPIRWGGAWTTDNLGSVTSARAALEQYQKIRKEQGRKPFVDGMHFELPKSIYE